MKKGIPAEYEQYLAVRDTSWVDEGTAPNISFRGFWIGTFLSFFLAIGAPYGNMIIRGSYMAWDFSTPGAIFLFLVLVGLVNPLFKLTTGRPLRAVLLAGALGGIYLYVLWPFDVLDPYSPGWLFSTFAVVSTLVNIPFARGGSSLALNRSELVLVYIMLLIVSAVCTLGLGEQILPILTAIFYYASPENGWAEKLIPQFPAHQIMVDDGHGNKSFYEGISRAGQSIPYGAWVEPMFWWGIFLLALYATMVSVAVILRRQWMERERLAYPLMQVPLALVRAEDDDRVLNRFCKSRAAWFGAAISLLMGSLQALHHYDPALPAARLAWNVSLIGQQNLSLHIGFAMVGFSYLINTHIAAGIFLFHLLSKFELEALYVMGLKSTQTITYGAGHSPLLAYQGVGALLAMVLVVLWTGRAHMQDVFLKAVGRAPQIDDADEILSYRSAMIGSCGGLLVMTGWLWLMGTPLWVSIAFTGVAVLIFIGVTRIVVEAGLAVVRTPMIAPDLIVYGLGSGLVGPTGVFNLSLAYIWTAGIRVFVMGMCANSLKLIAEMDRRNRRYAFWSIVLALLIGVLGSFWMIFHMAYQHGGINLNSWFFRGGPDVVYSNAARNLEPTEIYWPGLGFFLGGGSAMLLLMWTRQRLMWWPLHPLGFPIGELKMMNYVWFSVFLAWLIKCLILKYGGPAAYRRTQPFFLGLIAGQMLCQGIWLVVDYFTGMVGNVLYNW